MERRLHRIVHLVLGLSVVVLALAFLPGRRVYADANNCIGNALASFGMTEHHHEECTPSYTELVATRPAGGSFALVFVAAVAIGAGIVYRRPERWTAWLWAIWTVAAGIGAWLMTSFDLNLFDHVQTLWAGRVVEVGLGMIAVLVEIGAPIAAMTRRERATGSSAIARRRSRSP